MFIARDKNNDLYLFAELPKRGNECWWASKISLLTIETLEVNGPLAADLLTPPVPLR